MCLGLPMTIVETDGVSVLLLSDPPVGAKVLVYLDNAVRLLDDEEARLIADALRGLHAAMNG